MTREGFRRMRRTHLIVISLGLLLVLGFAAAQAQTDDSATPDGQVPVVAHLTAEPEAVLPGEQLSYVLSLENISGLDLEVSLSMILPTRFELALAALPAGASYQVRSSTVQWSGLVAQGRGERLVFLGRAPADAGADGSITATATLLQRITAMADSVSDPLAPSQITHLSATGWVGTPPTADFSYSVEDEAVLLTNLSQGVGPLSFSWDFGDGATSAESSPTHAYQRSGDYVVSLTAANPKGTSTASKAVRVTTLAPSQDGYAILVDDDTPAVGQLVYFGSASEPASVTMQWNFGDGVTSDARSPSHSYSAPGQYVVTRVLGEGTVAIQSSLVLQVGNAPEAKIQSSTFAPSVGELVNLTALTSSPETCSFFWDLGDGSTAGSGSVVYSYSAPGLYPVTVAVSNDIGVALDSLTLRVAYPMVFFPVVFGGLEGGQADDGVPVEQTAEAEAVVAVALPADPLAQEMLQSINREREANGLAALSWSDQLVRSAQHHTDDMASHWFTGHMGSDGSFPVDRMRQASYSGDYAGECTAWGFDDFPSALAWWMTSPPHRVIVLSTVATEIGGAYSHNPDSPSVHYWTIDFGAARAK